MKGPLKFIFIGVYIEVPQSMETTTQFYEQRWEWSYGSAPRGMDLHDDEPSKNVSALGLVS